MKYNKRYLLLVTIFCLFAVLAFQALKCEDELTSEQQLKRNCEISCSFSTSCCDLDSVLVSLTCPDTLFCLCVSENEVDCSLQSACCGLLNCEDDPVCACFDDDGNPDCGSDPQICCVKELCLGDPACPTQIFVFSVSISNFSVEIEEIIEIGIIGSGMYTDNQSLTRQTEEPEELISLRPGQTGFITLMDVMIGDIFRFGSFSRGQLIETVDCEFTSEFVDSRNPEVIWDGRFLTCNVW